MKTRKRSIALLMNYLKIYLMCLFPALSAIGSNRNNVNTQESTFFNLNRNTEKWSGLKLKTSNNRKKLKVLGICKFSGAREMLELSRLMDFNLQEALIMYAPGSRSGIGVTTKDRRTYLHVKGYNSNDLKERLLEGLKRDNDVIIIGHVDFFRLPVDVQKMIMKKIKSGTGLILAYTPKLNKLKSKICKKNIAGPDLFRALPKLYMPEMKEIKNVDSRIGFYSYGKGRIVMFNWPDDKKDMIRHKGLKFHSISYLPDWNKFSKNGWTYQFSLAVISRAIDWVVGQNVISKINKIEAKYSEESSLQSEIKINIFADAVINIKIDVFARNINNNICFQQNKELKLNKGENIVSLPIPKLPQGIYSYDCQLQYNKKIIDYGAAVFSIKKTCSINKVSLDKNIYKQYEMLNGSVFLAGNIKDKILLIEVYDAHKRLVGKKKINISSHKQRFSISPLKSYTTGNVVCAVLQDKNGKTLALGKEPYFIDRSQELRKLFAISVWAYLPSDYIGGKFLLPLKDYFDIDLYLPHYVHQKEEYLKNASEWALLNGFSSVSPSIWREYYFAKKNKEDIIRTPCLTSPGYKKYSQNKIKKFSQIASNYLPLYYGLGDESFLVHYWEGVNGRDVCASPTCNASFRKYLRGQYKSLEELNLKWNKKYSDWDDIKPEIFQSAVKNGNLSPWVDHRLHMSKVYMGKLEENVSVIKNIIPDALVGPEGFYKPDPYKGYDLSIFSTKFNFLGPYGYSMDPYTCNVFEALTPVGKACKRFAITGWYPNVNRRGEMYSRFEPWTTLLHGQGGLLLFSAIGLYAVGAVQDGITPGFNLSEYWRQVLDEAILIRNRYYNLISGSERNNKNIAIYYSQSSLIASLAFSEKESKRPIYFQQGQAWDIFLSSSSLDHTFISSEQVVAGKLNSEKKIKTLILPGIFCLSDKEIKEIQYFVKTGGILIADLLPGVMDEHGALRQKNILEKIFGVNVLDINLKKGKKVLYLNENTYTSVGKMMLMKSKTAKIFIKKSGSVNFCTNKYGKGIALLANATMPNYVELTKQGKNLPNKRFILAWLKEAGINIPFIQSENNTYNFLECIEYKKGDNSYLGILKSPQFSDCKPERFQVKFSVKKYIYNSQTGEFIGYLDEFTDKLNKKRANLYSLLSYKVSSIKLEPVKKNIKAGDYIELRIVINTKKGIVPGIHSLELTVNTQIEHSIPIDVSNGMKKIKIPTALNDKGKIFIRFIDAATGIKGQTEVEILE